MFANSKKKGMVQFTVKPKSDAAQVYLAGSFRDWRPVPMTKQKDGRYALEVKLTPGTHEYKFVIDGQWVTDPDHSHWAPNPYGSFNSVASIG